MVRPTGTTGRTHLIENKRQRVRTLYFDVKMSQSQICITTGYSKAQICNVIRAESVAVKPRSGRPRVFSPDQEEKLAQFVTASKKNRRMEFLQLFMVLFGAIFGI